MHDLQSSMKESMNAWVAEMKAINLPLIIQILEPLHKLDKLQVCFS